VMIWISRCVAGGARVVSPPRYSEDVAKNFGG
jgi:hypothetical protein